MTNHTHKLLVAWLIIFCAAPGALAQESSTTLDQSSPVLRSTTQLVQVNVIALDKEGRPVADLTANDFTLTDEGKAQHISVFSLEKSEPTSGQPRALPPGVFSNRWEDHPNAPASVTLILIDTVNTKLPDQAYAREQLLQFLKQMQPNNRIAIYAMGRHLGMLHDFSNDAVSLSRSVAAYKGEIPAYLDCDSTPGSLVATNLRNNPGQSDDACQGLSAAPNGVQQEIIT